MKLNQKWVSTLMNILLKGWKVCFQGDEVVKGRRKAVGKFLDKKGGEE